nr:MAG TPA: hypothetical protein [Caudoviricetes sp.]
MIINLFTCNTCNINSNITIICYIIFRILNSIEIFI